MNKKVNFNIIEKNKYANIEDISRKIQEIVNKLIVNEYAKSMEE